MASISFVNSALCIGRLRKQFRESPHALPIDAAYFSDRCLKCILCMAFPQPTLVETPVAVISLVVQVWVN